MQQQPSALLGTLQSTLAPDATTRLQAEILLSQLSASPQTAIDLARLTTDQSVDVSLRQITGFALKKYVKEWWSPFFPTFKGPHATTVEAKLEIRSLLFAGLSDPIRKIRMACAVIVSDVAHPDWPDDWPSLMTQLLQLISGTPASVEGGMRVLNDFVGIDLTEDQLLPIAQEMLPELLSVLAAPQTHSAITRARAILIFRQCVMTLFTVKDEHPAAVKAAISEILPRWLEAFRQLLEVDILQELSGDSWDCLAIRIAVFHSLEVILNSFPSSLKPTLAHFVTLSVSHLAALAPVYYSAFLSSTSEFSPPTSSDEDIPTDLPSLISNVLDFVIQASQRKALESLFVEGEQPTPLLGALLDAAVSCARMTTDDEESWATDPNAFVADEDDEAITYNVRAAAIDLVVTLVETFKTKALTALWSAFERTGAQSDAARTRSDDDWWKGYESVLTLVAAASPDLLRHTEERGQAGQPPAFDLARLFSSIVPAYLSASEFSFLQGRSFVFASKFSKALPVELASQYIDAAIAVLEHATATIPVKVSAIRALETFLRYLGDKIDATRAAHALSRLLPLVSQTTDNTLILVLEAARAALKTAGPVLDSATASELVKTILPTWLQKPEDPVLGSTIGDLFETLASISSFPVQRVVIYEALPTLSAAMTDVNSDPFSTRAAAAIDLVDSIGSGLPSPLPQGTFATFASPLFEALAISEDRDLIQSGLHVITGVVRKDVGQLLSWQDAGGRSGLELVLAQVARMLDPSGSESGGIYVGDLVIHLIRKAGSSLSPVLPDLLRAFATRLATAETASFTQSLILPFAYLIHTQCDTVLSLLEAMEVSVPASSPRPALEILLGKWCDTVDVFQGYWNLKVSTVALVQLFLSQRPSLQNVQVKGDLLLTAANTGRIMTRARTKNDPTQFPPIPFPAKALKVLLHDVQNASDEARKTDVEDAESDDGDDEWADDGAEFLNDDHDLAFLSDMLGNDPSLAKYMNDNGSEGEDIADEDLKDDPVYALDIQSHLLAFFRQAYESNANGFRKLAETYLNPSEKEVLAKCLQFA